MIPARNPQEATMSEIDAETQNELERLRAENEALKAKQSRQLRLQVSQKGAVSLYGIRRFPITFYAEEWEIVLGMANEVQSFIKEHEGELKRR
jgi:hypothetical protein